MGMQRVILIPGMGADERLFGPQRAAGLHFEVPEMTIPAPGDDMAAYARRIRDQLRLDGPCVIGGVSFGGMLACELSRICQARCVLLIASCASRAAVPRFYDAAAWVGRFLPDWFVRRRAAASARLFARLEGLDQAQYELLRDMSRQVPVPFLRRVGPMILRWDAPRSYPCPVHQIHGDRDRILPLHKVHAEEIVAGGGHLINLTHADQVNLFIKKHL